LESLFLSFSYYLSLKIACLYLFMLWKVLENYYFFVCLLTLLWIISLCVSLYLLRVEFCTCRFLSLFNKTDLLLIINNCKCFPNIRLLLFRTSGSFRYEHPSTPVPNIRQFSLRASVKIILFHIIKMWVLAVPNTG
jgi:hypothetical protein